MVAERNANEEVGPIKGGEMVICAESRSHSSGASQVCKRLQRAADDLETLSCPNQISL